MSLSTLSEEELREFLDLYQQTPGTDLVTQATNLLSDAINQFGDRVVLTEAIQDLYLADQYSKIGVVNSLYRVSDIEQAGSEKLKAFAQIFGFNYVNDQNAKIRIIRILKALGLIVPEAEQLELENLKLAKDFLDRGGQITVKYQISDILNADPQTLNVFAEIFNLPLITIMNYPPYPDPDRIIRILELLGAMEYNVGESPELTPESRELTPVSTPERAESRELTPVSTPERVEGPKLLSTPTLTPKRVESPKLLSTPVSTPKRVESPKLLSTPVSTPTLTPKRVESPKLLSTPVSTPTLTPKRVESPKLLSTPILTPKRVESPKLLSTPTLTPKRVESPKLLSTPISSPKLLSTPKLISTPNSIISIPSPIASDDLSESEESSNNSESPVGIPISGNVTPKSPSAVKIFDINDELDKLLEELPEYSESESSDDEGYPLAPSPLPSPIVPPKPVGSINKISTPSRSTDTPFRGTASQSPIRLTPPITPSNELVKLSPPKASLSKLSPSNELVKLSPSNESPSKPPAALSPRSSFLQAAGQGELLEVQQSAERNNVYNQAAQMAAKEGRLDIVKYLVGQYNINPKLIIESAGKTGKKDVIDWILINYPNLRTEAARYLGQGGYLNKLIDISIAPNSITPNSIAPNSIAPNSPETISPETISPAMIGNFVIGVAESGNNDLLKRVLTDYEIPQNYLNLALERSAYLGLNPIVKTLIQYGANNFKQAMFQAIQTGHQETANIFRLTEQVPEMARI